MSPRSARQAATLVASASFIAFAALPVHASPRSPARSTVLDLQTAETVPEGVTAVSLGAGAAFRRTFAGSVRVARNVGLGAELGLQVGTEATGKSGGMDVPLPDIGLSYKQQLLSLDWWWAVSAVASGRVSLGATPAAAAGLELPVLLILAGEMPGARLHLVPKVHYGGIGPTLGTPAGGLGMALVVPTGTEWSALIQIQPWLSLAPGGAGKRGPFNLDFPLRFGARRAWDRADVEFGFGLGFGDSAGGFPPGDVLPGSADSFLEHRGNLSVSAGFAF